MSVALLNVPVGTIIDFAGASTPEGYLECDGRAVGRSAYAALFAAIGTLWGAGNGSTTFNVPDLRGRCAIGAGTGDAGGATAHALASRGGDERLHKHGHGHTLKLPNHVHAGDTWTVHDKGGWSAEHGYGAIVVPNGADYANTPLRNSTDWRTGNPTSLPSVSGSVSDSGGGSSQNMQPFATVRKLIRAA